MSTWPIRHEIQSQAVRGQIWANFDRRRVDGRADVPRGTERELRVREGTAEHGHEHDGKRLEACHPGLDAPNIIRSKRRSRLHLATQPPSHPATRSRSATQPPSYPT